MSDTAEKTRTVTIQCPKHGEYTGEAVTLKFPGMKERKIDPVCPACQKEIEAEELRKKR
jgi:hypothetical protein